MTTPGSDDASGTLPGWWKAPGPALCPFCEQPHHFEAMLYCPVCDGMVCAVCVVFSVARDPRCPVCQDFPGEP